MDSESQTDQTQSSSFLLCLPPELRCEIYDVYLEDHRRVSYREQPSYQHLRMLLICKQIYTEAKPILQRYVSLSHERQIAAFIKSDVDFSRVTYADVANDGRLVQTMKPAQGLHPLSQLYLAIRLLTSLRHLRVFECRQGLPFTTTGTIATRLVLQSEQAMFPTKSGPELKSYELMLLPDTRAWPLSILTSTSLRRLRLSGVCILPASTPMPNLRSLSLHGTDGNFFDRHTFTECFPDMHQLEEFSFALLQKTGFELRNRHLESLVQCSGHTMRKLVLLECTRLTSATIADCLANLPNLEYFALSLVTVEELEANFLLSLPPRVEVLKLKVTNAWYAIVLYEKEQLLYDTMETFIQERPFRVVAMNIRSSIMGPLRVERCQRIASSRGITFTALPWAEDEIL
ncbi:hypothetical protein EIP91_008643 [Steccherinum ochraceum]|uniref:F-box domain-containing protein n=1 Tax=Steccherinum ochraceum TaxID=92696 RepID=A0A4R0R879_9APHY|nr:hypothetical protein EIP91_008643 [Steccherinum ochraceum]